MPRGPSRLRRTLLNISKSLMIERSLYAVDLCSVQDAIDIVVSQDGGVRFVAHEGGRLVHWPYLP